MISLRDVVTGFGNRDPLAEVWRRSLRGGGGGSAEITGTLPLRYIGNGKPLTDYMIYGNTVQDGTPTPEAPVDVAGCGVRTENLAITERGGVNKDTGVDQSYTNSRSQIRTQYVQCASNTTYIFSSTLYPAQSFIAFYDKNKQYLSRTSGYTLQTAYAFNTPNGAAFMRATFYNNDSEIQIFPYSDGAKITLNLGSTALPYEPYGYKLPLTVNGTEYPIYLGQVETTRRIKKMVFDGTENWELNNNKLMFARTTTKAIPYESTVCTHYIGARSFAEVINTTKSIAVINVGIYVNSGSTDVANFKSYLAAQYAAGTPVTVWYVLAEPETGIVNEPLMKIGDYADTISYAQAGMTIPTVSGANVLDMTSPVKPSEVYINVKGIKPTNNPNFENGG